jgi:hypothetical protein
MQSIKSEEHARAVTLAGTNRDDALEQHRRAVAGAEDIDGMKLKEGVPDFTKESLYSFVAEHALIEDNLIIHFFVPAHAKPHIKGDNNPAERQWMDYWLKKFPVVLDTVARRYFDAEYPRLQAKYTPEVASWWFKAQGYGKLISPSKFIHQFLVELDDALKAHS